MSDDARTTETRRRLIEATMETIRTQGIAKVSARTIAAAGGVNQALVFYHFGTVDALIAHACVVSTRERVDSFRARFDAVTTFTGLVQLGRTLHEEEAALGNVTVLGQTLAGSQANPALAAATGEALGMWTEELERVLGRLLADSPFGELLEPRLLAELVSSAFIGIELVAPTRVADGYAAGAGGIPGGGGAAARTMDTAGDALARLEGLARSIDGLGPVARRALRTALRRV
ncbi:TetR/AcrR family transcriptional regulator [Lapillicoccus sp.]|uniref:TetR/AcrR family transcriptional regulator n=1 Tax=Lapillicoccus sp. TaxID=1909287 RepID=UPI0025F2B3E7|nr:TetR/AcrR family transcriptional regulator [Lapillicoccus sp.]